MSCTGCRVCGRLLPALPGAFSPLHPTHGALQEAVGPLHFLMETRSSPSPVLQE